MSPARSFATAAWTAVLLAATLCAAQTRPASEPVDSRPASDAAATTRADEKAEATLPPVPAWLARTSLIVCCVGGAILLTWVTVRRRRTLDFAPVPKKAAGRITGVQALGGICLWLLLQVVGGSLAQYTFGLKNPDDAKPAQMLVIQGASMAGGVAAILLMLEMVRRGSKVHPADLGVTPRRLGKALGLGVLAFVAIYPLTYGVWFVTELGLKQFGYQPRMHKVVQEAVRHKLRWYVNGLTLMSVGVAPVLEEMFFRGFLQTYFRRQIGDRRLAILAAAAVFGAAHFFFWESVPALFVLGLGLGFAYEKTENIAAPIVVHVLFNLMTMLQFY